MNVDNQDQSSHSVILSAAKDLCARRTNRSAREILRCAQDDRGEDYPIFCQTLESRPYKRQELRGEST